ncbi:MAG: hypothetical protein IJP44_11950 [Bacteroidales bacterium]|nr:hypothetical protein [Bacteroidales bacterium]
MNDIFEHQKEKLLSLSHEINLLRQQVNYLLRNEKAIGLLDLDVLMNRTHTVYDMLCSINLGDNADDGDVEFDAEAFSGLFGSMTQESPQEEMEETDHAGSQEDEREEETLPEEPAGPMEEAPSETPAEASITETAIAFDEMPTEELVGTSIEQDAEAPDEKEVEPSVEQAKEEPVGDEFGFFFRFEDMPPEEKKAEEPAVEEQPADPVYMDDKLVHFVKEVPEDQIPDRDLEYGEPVVKEELFKMPQVEEPDFEIAKPEILGEKMLQEDHSLAAKYQQNPVRDLKSVIGINDKFLFVNELFGGSMDKYNKSIENLNDLKTLNGAMIYLNELKIELQWNSSNEAYRKLSELVVRKFE